MAKFINPYNFIPIGSKKSGNAGKGELSGVIHYSVLTKTPLFIPNTAVMRHLRHHWRKRNISVMISILIIISIRQKKERKYHVISR